ncbi:MAG: fibronectin type III domain-containing protein [Bacteroides sp.]|nr:fibronectin type III domain-containing protein [Bacteroides sp.]
MNRTNISLKLITLLFLLPAFTAGGAYGQTVSPVSSQTFLHAPYQYNINNWANMPDNRLRLRLRLLDTRVENATLLLRMRMVSENLSVENAMPLPVPVPLAGGGEVELGAYELRTHFLPANLSYAGNGKQAFLQSGGMLPDGVYRLYFEVYEARSGNKVSIQESPAIFKLVAGDPPLINTPRYGSTQYYGKQSAIRFQWTPRHLHVAGFFQTEYTFELAEIPEGAENWKEYFYTLPLILKTTTSRPFYDYGPESPQLIPGKRYAFRVRAACSNAENEQLYIKNDGYSEVFLLYYEEDCPIVPQLRVTDVRSTTATIAWSEPVEAQSYTLQYRKNGNPDARWFKVKDELPAGTTMYRLTDLAPATGYECKLTVQCTYSQSENDAVYRFTTLSDDNAGLKCGKHEPKDTEPKDQTPLKQLLRFDQVRAANGFVFEIEEAEGQEGVFSGTGYTHIPLLANTGVKVKFKNIFVNKNYELVSGVFTAESDTKSL